MGRHLASVQLGNGGILRGAIGDVSVHGRHLVAVSVDGRNALWWDLLDGPRQIGGLSSDATGARHDRYVSVQSAGGRTLFVARKYKGREIEIAEGVGGRPKRLATLDYHGDAALSPSGNLLAVGGWYDHDSPRGIGIMIHDLDRYAPVIECVEVGESCRGGPAWSADERRVAFNSVHHVFVLDLPSRTLVRARKGKTFTGGGHVRLALSADGSRLALAGEDGSRVWLLALPPTTSSTRSPS
jgi:hypothetical protein